jgi:hypothetical protein
MRSSIYILVSILLTTVTLTPAFAAESVNINVDFTQKIHDVTDLSIGVDESTYGRIDTYFTKDQVFRDRIKNLGIKHMRIHLEYSTPGDPKSAIVCEAAGCPKGESGDAWIQAIKSIGAQVTLIVPNNTVDAANLVKHFNKETNLHIDRWIIENEPDNHNIDATTYSNAFNKTYDAMKAVEPQIKIGGPANAYFNKSFIQTFLNISGSRVDFIDYHAYAQGGDASHSEQQLLQNTKVYEDNAQQLRTMIATTTTTKNRAGEIDLQVGEWNLDWNGDPKLLSHFNTIWSASALGHILKSGSYALTYADKNGSLGVVGERDATEKEGFPSNEPLPIYYGIGMYTGQNLFRRFGTQLVQATTSNPKVEVFASNSEKNIVVLNPDPTATYTIALKLTGFTTGEAQLWQKNKTQPLKAPPQKIETKTIQNGNLNLDIPPYSVTTFVLTEKTPTPSPTPTHCLPLGNIDCAGGVTSLDLAYLLSKLGTKDPKADLDNSGEVNSLDLGQLIKNLG